MQGLDIYFDPQGFSIEVLTASYQTMDENEHDKTENDQTSTRETSMFRFLSLIARP